MYHFLLSVVTLKCFQNIFGPIVTALLPSMQEEMRVPEGEKANTSMDLLQFLRFHYARYFYFPLAIAWKENNTLHSKSEFFSEGC